METGQHDLDRNFDEEDGRTPVSLEEGIGNWKAVEEQCIKSCDQIMASTDNVVVGTIASIVKMDSQKHFEVLDLISDALTGSITMTAEEAEAVNELIKSHIKLEEEALAFAELAVKDRRHFVVHELISYLILDEEKHHKLLNLLLDYHQRLFAYL